MLNIGPPELLLIIVIALVVVGPQRLPELGRTIGRGLREFRKVQDEVRDMVDTGMGEDLKQTANELKQTASDLRKSHGRALGVPQHARTRPAPGRPRPVKEATTLGPADDDGDRGDGRGDQRRCAGSVSTTGSDPCDRR